MLSLSLSSTSKSITTRLHHNHGNLPGQSWLFVDDDRHFVAPDHTLIVVRSVKGMDTLFRSTSIAEPWSWRIRKAMFSVMIGSESDEL
jgi:hypothetical protein